MMRPLSVLCSTVLLLVACDDGGDAAPEPISLLVTIENIAQPGTLVSSATDETRDILISPGIWAVHARGVELFSAGAPASPGLKTLAEEGNGQSLTLELTAREDIESFGGFPASDGATYSSDPIEPGDVVTFEVSASTDEHLSFAAMFIHSNDILVATPAVGLELELGPDEVVDVSTRLELWDAGTELNEEPGFGEHQPMQGPGGTPEDGVVHRVDGTDAAGWSYPSVDEFLRVTMTRR
jgi:hypothetical protein